MAGTSRAQREKLLANKAAIEARLRRIDARERAKERKADTRRKILAGAAVLDRAKKDPAYRTTLYQGLDGFLVRADDRALFGLAPLGSSGEAVEAVPPHADRNAA